MGEKSPSLEILAGEEGKGKKKSGRREDIYSFFSIVLSCPTSETERGGGKHQRGWGGGKGDFSIYRGENKGKKNPFLPPRERGERRIVIRLERGRGKKRKGQKTTQKKEGRRRKKKGFSISSVRARRTEARARGEERKILAQIPFPR